jgi:hypothetical protein
MDCNCHTVLVQSLLLIGGCVFSAQQVVIIAAGYDTRAYRLAKPGVKFYEIDLPHASEKKQQLVKKHMPEDKVRFATRFCARWHCI